jgi:hypothetical protein
MSGALSGTIRDELGSQVWIMTCCDLTRTARANAWPFSFVEAVRAWSSLIPPIALYTTPITDADALAQQERPRLLTPEERSRLLTLRPDPTAVWQARTTTSRIARQLLRTLIDDIILTVAGSEKRRTWSCGGRVVNSATSI